MTLSRSQAEGISALRKLAEHVGLIAPSKGLKISDKELRRRLEQYGWEVPMMCAVILLSNAEPRAKAAAAILLECFLPGWQALAPELVGQVIERDDRLVSAWRSAVLKRDGNKCRSCGATENLHAHHIAAWAVAPHLRVIEENGLTLCGPCHRAEHAKAA